MISGINVGKSGNISLISLDEGILLYRHPMDGAKLGQKIYFRPETTQLIQSADSVGAWTQNSSVDKKRKTFGLRINRQFNYLVATGLAESDFLTQWYVNLATAVVIVFAFGSSLIWVLIKYIGSLEHHEKQKNSFYESSRKTAIGRIASGVAHEINNPLAIIKGKSEIARMIIDDSKLTDSRLVENLLDIEKMVVRIAKIIKGLQILEQSRIEENSVYPLKDLLLPAIEVLSQKMSDSSIELNLERIPDSDIDCNRAELIEVFVHLLSNSVDAIMNLKVKWISVAFERRDEYLMIKITDAGSGMSEAEANHILDPFYTTKQPGSGTGLGLSVSDAILCNHGGSLSCNVNSKNTQFVVSIKVHNAAVDAA